MDDHIYIEQHKKIEYVWTVEISNPGKKNSLTPNILDELSEFLSNQDVKKTARAIIIRGKGYDAFSAGYDISKIKKNGDQGETEATAKFLFRTINYIKNFPAPLISMISGFCIGAGLHLAITTDMRIASDNSKMGITPAKLGILYHPDGMLDFFNLIGPANTREMFYTGNLYSAEDAMTMGLVNRVVPLSDLEETVYNIAGQISKNAPLSVRGAKYAVNRYVEALSINPEIRKKIIQLREETLNSEDLKEGRAAFAEKRRPAFKGIGRRRYASGQQNRNSVKK